MHFSCLDSCEWSPKVGVGEVGVRGGFTRVKAYTHLHTNRYSGRTWSRKNEDMMGNIWWMKISDTRMIPPVCKWCLWVWKPSTGSKTKPALIRCSGREKRQHKNWNQRKVCRLPWERVIKGVLLSTRSNMSVSWCCHERLRVALLSFLGSTAGGCLLSVPLP